MNLANPFAQMIIAIALVAAGWIAHRVFARYAPSEKALALRFATKAVHRLDKLQSSSPEDMASAAAAQASEAALLAAFKDAAARLK